MNEAVGRARVGRAGAPATAFVLSLGAGCLVATLPWFHAYSSLGSRSALVVASVAPVLVALLASRILRLRAPVGFALSAVALLLTLLALSGFAPEALGSGLVHGPGRVLTETLPLPGGAVSAVAVLTVWVAGAAAGELAFRPAQLSHLSGASLAVPVLSLMVALSVTAPAPARDWFTAPVLLVLLGASAVARQRWTSREVEPVVDSRGTAAATTPAPTQGAASEPSHLFGYRPIGLVALLAAVVGAAVPALPWVRSAPTSVYEPPPMSSGLVVDPVATLGALRDVGSIRHDATVLRVTTRGPTDGYLTVAVLDAFDGSEWTFDSTFEPSGGRIPVPPGYVRPTLDASNLSASVTLAAPLPVPLLPIFERPSQVDGLPIAADSVHGMVAPDQGLSFPVRYSAVSAVPVTTFGDVPAADGIAAPDAVQTAGDLELPADSTNAMVTAARFVASITGRRPVATIAFLQEAMAAVERTDRRLDPASGEPSGGALGGTSLSQVINAVTVNRSGTPEQFATFFALLARYLGVPARVATGFLIRSTSRTAVLPPGSYDVSERHAWTWVEIPVAGIGWVVADPTPVATTSVGAPPPEQVQPSPTTLPAPKANAVPRNQAVGGHAVAKRVQIRNRQNSGPAALGVAAIASGGLALLLLAALAVPAAIRRVRSKRRFSPDPALLAGGAWLELLDSLSRAGMDISEGWTRSEVAAEAGRHFGADVPSRVEQVGAVADRAMCSLADPPDRDSAIGAWEAQDHLGRDIYRRLDRRQRALSLLTIGDSNTGPPARGSSGPPARGSSGPPARGSSGPPARGSGQRPRW